MKKVALLLLCVLFSVFSANAVAQAADNADKKAEIATMTEEQLIEYLKTASDDQVIAVFRAVFEPKIQSQTLAKKLINAANAVFTRMETEHARTLAKRLSTEVKNVYFNEKEAGSIEVFTMPTTKDDLQIYKHAATLSKGAVK